MLESAGGRGEGVTPGQSLVSHVAVIVLCLLLHSRPRPIAHNAGYQRRHSLTPQIYSVPTGQRRSYHFFLIG